MKTANFPARKEARRLAAQHRASGNGSTTSQWCRAEVPQQFFMIRTKKVRTSAFY